VKVFATMETETAGVILKEWPSIKVFESQEYWCDPKFIRVTTSAGLKSYDENSYMGFVIYTESQKKSHKLLHGAYKKHQTK